MQKAGRKTRTCCVLDAADVTITSAGDTFITDVCSKHPAFAMGIEASELAQTRFLRCARPQSDAKCEWETVDTDIAAMSAQMPTELQRRDDAQRARALGPDSIWEDMWRMRDQQLICTRVGRWRMAIVNPGSDLEGVWGRSTPNPLMTLMPKEPVNTQ